jgi:hypothetical protein
LAGNVHMAGCTFVRCACYWCLQKGHCRPRRRRCSATLRLTTRTSTLSHFLVTPKKI